MLTKAGPQGISPDVPCAGTFGGIVGYERNMLRAMKNTFAGRSPSRRMK